MRCVLLLAVLSLLASCQWARQQAATPQRPTVSYDTATTATGTVEIETGVNHDPDDSFDSPTTLKFGVDDHSEIFVGYSPFLQLHQPGPDASGGGDVVLGARTRVFDAGDGRPSGAIVLTGKLPTASSALGLGSGQTDLRIGGILNQQFGPLSMNAFYQYGALGTATGGTTSEHTATLTAGCALTERCSAFGELAGIFVPSAGQDSIFAIMGATFAPDPWLVIDCGVTVGLSSDAPDLQLFVGCTHNFGSLF